MKQRHLASTWTTCYSEAEIREIRVEVLIRSGLPRFDIIGLPQHMIQEGRDRILAALGSLGIELPSQKVLVSLNPGSIKKEGTHFDLPILVGILKALGTVANRDDRRFYWGELALEGQIQPLESPLNHWLMADSLKADLLVSGIEPASADLQKLFRAPLVKSSTVADLLKPITSQNDPRDIPVSQTIDAEIERTWLAEDLEDWPQLEGSVEQIDLLAMSLLGRHHLLLQGPPGCGKTTWMYKIAHLQLPLPHSSWCEQRQAIRSSELGRRPFASPHHSASRASILGGGSGSHLHPGALAGAHHGAIFFDEFAEYSRDVLEGLREPMELKHVSIARAVATKTLPCDTQVLAAMNACKCGRLGSAHDCTCTPGQHKAYRSRISGPLRERFHFDVWWRFVPGRLPLVREFKQRLLEAHRAPHPRIESPIPLPRSLSPRRQKKLMEALVSFGRWNSLKTLGPKDLERLQQTIAVIEGDIPHEHQRVA